MSRGASKKSNRKFPTINITSIDDEEINYTILKVNKLNLFFYFKEKIREMEERISSKISGITSESLKTIELVNDEISEKNQTNFNTNNTEFFVQNNSFYDDNYDINQERIREWQQRQNKTSFEGRIRSISETSSKPTSLSKQSTVGVIDPR